MITLAARHRVPAVCRFRYYVVVGGLICYVPNEPDKYRSAGRSTLSASSILHRCGRSRERARLIMAGCCRSDQFTLSDTTPRARALLMGISTKGKSSVAVTPGSPRWSAHDGSLIPHGPPPGAYSLIALTLLLRQPRTTPLG